MPDVPKCGGLVESRKIVNLAGMYYVPFAPHLVSTPLGTSHVWPAAKISGWTDKPSEYRLIVSAPQNNIQPNG
ncbi:enolase C-terminal domain-like protein [Mesorhizobium sp. LjNodule214]|uniref:enolase C-terminal domain-like protein n=1 Tax=Mesorhizobium sp. LjNodule214 TaxID=3342252 RepID=UPI003ED083A9